MQSYCRGIGEMMGKSRINVSRGMRKLEHTCNKMLIKIQHLKLRVNQLELLVGIYCLECVYQRRKMSNISDLIMSWGKNGKPNPRRLKKRNSEKYK